MEELRNIIAHNLVELRKNHGLTQLELAEKFNYSDRAVSKWENGETVPDIEVLYKLCEFYGVTLDYLTHKDNKQYVKDDNSLKLGEKISITSLVISIIWFLATVIFIWPFMRNKDPFWQAFIWAVPFSALFLLGFNRNYFKKRLISFFSYSIFVWGIIASVYFTWLNYNIWPLFILGIPAQVSLIIWLNIRKTFKKDK